MKQISKKDRDILYAVLNEIAEMAEKICQINLSKNLKSAFPKIIRCYSEHKKEYNLCVTSFDPYKICAWSLDYFINELELPKTLIIPIIIVMLKFLKIESKEFNYEQIKYIISIYKNNNAKDDLAIGKNGLFMIFWSVSNVKVLQKINQKQGE